MLPETAKLDDVDIGALALDGPSDGQSKNIFAFETSGTWDAAGDDDSDSNWRGVLGSASRKSKAQGVAQTPVGPATFLSFSSSNTWGAPGFAGLGGDGAKAAD